LKEQKNYNRLWISHNYKYSTIMSYYVSALYQWMWGANPPDATPNATASTDKSDANSESSKPETKHDAQDSASAVENCRATFPEPKAFENNTSVQPTTIVQQVTQQCPNATETQQHQNVPDVKDVNEWPAIQVKTNSVKVTASHPALAQTTYARVATTHTNDSRAHMDKTNRQVRKTGHLMQPRRIH
jgi:hypothetical protein